MRDDDDRDGYIPGEVFLGPVVSALLWTFIGGWTMWIIWAVCNHNGIYIP